MKKITKNIICMKWGTRYGPEFTNRLFSMVKRHMNGTLGQDYRFVCITDNEEGLEEGIECKPLPPLNDDLPDNLKNKPWLKLLVWEDPLFDLEGDALFLDVDLLVTGPLDPFFDYEPGKFCGIHNWTEPGKNTANTSVFRFPIGKFPQIIRDFRKDIDGIYAAHRIEQRYISAVLHPLDEQRFWPKGWCLSFKEDIIPAWPLRWWCTPKLPEEGKIIVFHGKPDPDEAIRGEWPTKKGQGWKKIYKKIKPVSWIADHWQ